MNAACSIIASNYAPQARYLIESLRTTNPNLKFFLLVTDDEALSDPFFLDIEIVIPHDLNVDPATIKRMSHLYDMVEFATALKPYLLSYILALPDGYETVTFLDPDIEVFSSLELGIELAKSNSVSLTPHRLRPTFETNSYFDETELLRYGTFNLGFICVSKAGGRMLEWWQNKLELQCTRFPDSDVFTDQKWINLLPGYFDFAVIKNSGYNVSSWNIDERIISKRGSIYFAGSDKIVFIHYSQMSGELAKGGKTSHWTSNTIKSDEVSQQLIADLTNNYAIKLQAYAKHLVHNKKKVKQRVNSGIIRERQINLLRMNVEVNLDEHNKYIFRFLNLFAKLERSSAYRGLRKGFYNDLIRLKIKFKKKNFPF